MSYSGFATPPLTVDRVIVHQFDPARPSPGGIDTCLRGIMRYLPEGHRVAVVGVDTGDGPAGRRLGRWEAHTLGGETFWFLPVVRLDPGDQRRRIPHSVRLLAGLTRYRRRIPAHTVVQVHRMDSAAALRWVFKGSTQAYFVHTQENGLVGATSDSFWRHLGGAHQAIERSVVKNARSVVVFNEDYARKVQEWNPAAIFSPTWFDPALIDPNGLHANKFEVLWVGRLEIPKDPVLAIDVFEELTRADPANPWSISMLGSGTLAETVSQRVESLPEGIRERVHLLGRVAPHDVARRMSLASVFLMTSHAGYEGYPRVLVEAMASGLPAVVTEGSDTGHLVVDGMTGYTAGRSAKRLASLVLRSAHLDRSEVAKAVGELGAPALVKRIFALTPTPDATAADDGLSEKASR